MNTDPDGFELDAPAADPEKETARGEAPTPRSGLRHPSYRHGDAPRAARERARGPAGEGRGTWALPFPFRGAFLLLLGAVVLLVLWAGGLFFGTGGWPWEIFRAEDGSFVFAWDGPHVFTVLGAFFVVFYLGAAVTPATRARGAMVLTVAALGLVTLPVTDMLARAAVLMGLAAAAILSREGLRAGAGGRGFLFVTLLLLGATLFFPHPAGGTGYAALGTDLFRNLFGGADFGDTLLAPETGVVLMSLVLLVVALLSLLGVGGRFSVWVAGIALLVGVFGSMVLAWRATSDTGTCLATMQGVAKHVPASLALALPAAAGALDASRP